MFVLKITTSLSSQHTLINMHISSKKPVKTNIFNHGFNKTMNGNYLLDWQLYNVLPLCSCLYMNNKHYVMHNKYKIMTTCHYNFDISEKQKKNQNIFQLLLLPYRLVKYLSRSKYGLISRSNTPCILFHLHDQY